MFKAVVMPARCDTMAFMYSTAKNSTKGIVWCSSIRVAIELCPLFCLIKHIYRDKKKDLLAVQCQLPATILLLIIALFPEGKYQLSQL